MPQNTPSEYTTIQLAEYGVSEYTRIHTPYSGRQKQAEYVTIRRNTHMLASGKHVNGSSGYIGGSMCWAAEDSSKADLLLGRLIITALVLDAKHCGIQSVFIAYSSVFCGVFEAYSCGQPKSAARGAVIVENAMLRGVHLMGIKPPSLRRVSNGKPTFMDNREGAC